MMLATREAGAGDRHRAAKKKGCAWTQLDRARRRRAASSSSASSARGRLRLGELRLHRGAKGGRGRRSGTDELHAAGGDAAVAAAASCRLDREAGRQSPRRSPVLARSVGARELGQAVGINSAVFLLGYKVLSSGLSNAAVVHSWFLGTACLAAFQVQGYALVCLYFVVGTLATKIGKRTKMAEGTYERNEGKRTPASVWGSGFAGCACAIFALLLGAFSPPGPPLDQAQSLLRVGFVASFASKLSDTVASEIGKAFGRTTVLITNLRRVPRGTDGAVSLEGTAAGLAASAVYAGVALSLGQVDLAGAAACVFAAFVANNLESVLGATLQQSTAFLTNDIVNCLQITAASLISIAAYQIL
mmetsp:Transcript_40179/g.85800  ORF Transcript_40179/g.85800 Transcript_40179/m.85800 type:complete len:360 (-) Transcript_40179:42-1121(-)